MIQMSKFPKPVRYNKNTSGTYNKVTNSSRYNGMVSSLKTHMTYNSVKEMRKSESSSASPFKLVFGLFFLVLLLIATFRVTGNIGDGTPLTFTGFLHYLSTLNFGVVDFSFIDLTIGGDWGAFNFLLNFLNLFTGIIEFSITVIGLLINVVIFILDLVKFIFLG